MKFQRTLAALSAAALSAALFIPSAGALTFLDTQDHPAEHAIDLFSDLEILKGNGDGYFLPDQAISRGDMCTILDRVFSFINSVPNTFPDLDPTAWYAEPMLRLNAVGIIQGDGVGIRPLDTIRWDEALVMIARSFSLTPNTSIKTPFETADWAQGYLATMWAAGYFSAEDFDPAAPFTRADTVTVLNNVINHLGWSAAGKTLTDGRLIPLVAGQPATSIDFNAFYWSNGRMYYNDGSTPVAYGIDVSRHQNYIDWNAVANDGIDFAIIRLGYRGYGEAGTLNLDANFEYNYSAALAAGLDVGIYFFSQAISVEEAIVEANYVLKHLAGRPLTYPIAFDWEPIGYDEARTDNIDTPTLNACIKAFCETITAAGYTAMTYSNTREITTRYDLSQLTKYPFWYAYYSQGSTIPQVNCGFRMWQYSSTGTVAGIEGNVDMDLCLWPFGKSHTDTEPSVPGTPAIPGINFPFDPNAPAIIA